MRGFGTLAFCVAAVGSLSTTNSLAVEVGDVAVISFASDNPDALAFVVLREIPASTPLRFTDSGWFASGGFRANEGGIQYVSGSALTPGTVISRQDPFDSGGWSVNSEGVGSNGFALATAGDQILTFVGSGGSPSFVHAVNFDSAGYDDATSSNTTGLPTGLTVGYSAVDVPEADNGYYDGPTSGTPTELLTAIANPSNWTTSDSPITPPAWSFSVDNEGPLLVDVSVPGTQFAIGQMVAVTVTLSDPPEVGSPVTVDLTSGAFTATEQVVISNPDSVGVVNVTLANEGYWTIEAEAVSGGAGTEVSESFTVGNPMIPPIADAGPDRSVPLASTTVTVFLDGASGDDPDGLTGASYEWTPASGAGIIGWANRTGSLTSQSDPATASVTFNAVGTYELTLTITDDDNLVDFDMATISITEPGPDDEFEPPPGYYSGATGLGSTLKSQLSTIMTSGHNQQSYGDFRYNAAYYDADPQVPGNILLVYNRASVAAGWDGGATWSREHVWPQSRQPGTASNSSLGNLGDPFALRPVNPSLNSQRSNKPFGTVSASGASGDRDAYWFPGEEDKGDIARSNFYSATRYMSSLSLVSGIPSGDTMGDLDSLVRWNYTDVPDFFERRRNQRIYEDQNNRNAFIDHPEFVWTIFGDGANDSTLYVSATEPTDGASTASVVFPTVIVGGPIPSPTSVALHKAGADPTYYSVTSSGDAGSSVSGRFNAFDLGPQLRSIDVGVAVSTASAGEMTGTIVIDNLDVSSEGTGQGSADGDDVINVSFTVLDHSEASFVSGSDQNTWTIDFGTVCEGCSVSPATFEIHNLPSGSGFTAGLDLQMISSTGNDGVLTTDAQTFTDLTAGQNVMFEVNFDTSSGGAFVADYTFTIGDVGLPGATTGTPLTLHVTGTVEGVAAIPTASTWGMMCLTLMLLIYGSIVLGRRGVALSARSA